MTALDDLRDIAVMYERQIESMRAERRMLVDALLRVEISDNNGGDPCFACCRWAADFRHADGCALDAALTRVGLDTQAARDAARLEMKPDTAESRDAARGGR